VRGSTGGTAVEAIGADELVAVEFIEDESVEDMPVEVEFVEVEFVVMACSINVLHSGVPSFSNADPAPTTYNVQV
jgi:hypothetical protein